MSNIHVEMSRVINATPAAVHAVISDYHVGHPAILPKPYFKNLMVKKGGKGAGTEMTFDMEVFGSKRTFHQTVSEPEPGRVLVETEVDGSVVTKFFFDPVEDGTRCRVTITTDMKAASGIQGLIERLVIPRFNPRLYQQELQLLADYVEKQ
jgi:hypothetical protein